MFVRRGEEALMVSDLAHLLVVFWAMVWQAWQWKGSELHFEHNFFFLPHCVFISDAFCRWEGSSTDEVGKNKETGKVLVRVNPKYYRPTEVVSTAHCSPNTVNPCGGFPGKHQMNVFHSLAQTEEEGGEELSLLRPPHPHPPASFAPPLPATIRWEWGADCAYVLEYICVWVQEG